MTSTKGGVRRWRPGPLAAAIALATVSVFPAFLAGAVSVQIRAELGLGPAQFGAAVSAYFAASAVSVAIVGRAVDRVGERRGYVVGAALAAASLVGVAVAARSWALLVIFLAAGGIGNAVVGPAASRLLARAIDPARRGIAFGAKQAAIMIATLLGGVGVPVLAVTHGWRWVYVMGAAIAVCLFALTPQNGTVHHNDSQAGVTRQRRRTLLLLATAFGLGTSASIAMTTFLVDYAVHRGVSEGRAGALLAAGSVGAIVVRLVLGWWTSAGTRRAEYTMAAILIASAAAMAVLAGLDQGSLIPGAVIAFTLVWGWTGLLVYIVAVNNLASPGAATGFVQTGAATGGVLGPSALGLVAERASYQAMWLVGAGMLAIAAVCVAAAIRVEKQRSDPAPRSCGAHHPEDAIDWPDVSTPR